MPNDFYLKKIPLSKLAEITFKAYTGNFRVILLTALLIIIPYNLILILIPTPSQSDLQNYFQNAFNPANVQSFYSVPEIQNAMQYLYSILAATILFNPLVAAVCAYISKQHIGEKTSDFKGMIDASIGRWGKHIITSIMYNVSVSIGVLLVLTLLSSVIGALFGFVLLVPLIKFGVGMAFFTIITATSDKWALNALKESYNKIKRHILGAIGILLLSSVLSYFFSSFFIFIIDSIVMGAGSTNGALLTAYYFVVGIINDTLKLFFQMFTAMWFFNRVYASETEERKIYG